MALCVKCGEPYQNQRAELGYRTCTECGEHAALQEAKRRKKCVAPAYNKGAYQYIGSKDTVKWIGRK